MALLKALFAFSFSTADLLPMMDFENVVRNDSVLRYFSQQALLDEQLMRWQRSQEQASILAQAAGESASRTRTSEERHLGRDAEAETTKTYVITYYNPETHKAEVLETKSHISIHDDVKRVIEESLGMQSLYPIYAFIGAPIIRQEVLPWKLEQILSQREYGTPPPSAGGAGPIPVRVVAQTQAEIVAAKKQADAVRESVARAVEMKAEAGRATDEEIIVLDEAVAAIRRGEDAEKSLERLPPLSRARYLAALRRRRLGVQVILQMLIRDTEFLKTVKKKLQALGFEDLVNLVRMLRELRKK
ncbi:MAG: hypothetical protein PHV13_05280 [Candidatus ainarchaeum sp.]|nr:hypothetical protein [Candidatus ainarchaeum sp.]